MRRRVRPLEASRRAAAGRHTGSGREERQRSVIEHDVHEDGTPRELAVRRGRRTSRARRAAARAVRFPQATLRSDPRCSPIPPTVPWPRLRRQVEGESADEGSIRGVSSTDEVSRSRARSVCFHTLNAASLAGGSPWARTCDSTSSARCDSRSICSRRSTELQLQLLTVRERLRSKRVPDDAVSGRALGERDNRG